MLIINYVGSNRLRGVCGRNLMGAGGLMGAAGVPNKNLVFTDSTMLKADPFIANDLTHFVDDKIDVLTSVRASWWQ